MVRLPAARTFASVPVSSTGVSSVWVAALAVMNRKTQRSFMRLRRDDHTRLDAALVLVGFGGGQQLAFPLRDRRRGDRVADRVGGRAAHVEKHVDAENEKQAGLRDVELVEGRRDHHQRRTRRPSTSSTSRRPACFSFSASTCFSTWAARPPTRSATRSPRRRSRSGKASCCPPPKPTRTSAASRRVWSSLRRRMKLLWVFLFITASAAAQTEDTPVELTGTLAKVRAAGSLTIAYREASVPFSYLSPRGEPIGYSIELCRKLAEAIGEALGRELALKWLAVTSETRIDAIVKGSADLECGSTTNNLERQR